MDLSEQRAIVNLSEIVQNIRYKAIQVVLSVDSEEEWIHRLLKKIQQPVPSVVKIADDLVDSMSHDL